MAHLLHCGTLCRLHIRCSLNLLLSRRRLSGCTGRCLQRGCRTRGLLLCLLGGCLLAQRHIGYILPEHAGDEATLLDQSTIQCRFILGVFCSSSHLCHCRGNWLCCRRSLLLDGLLLCTGNKPDNKLTLHGSSHRTQYDARHSPGTTPGAVLHDH